MCVWGFSHCVLLAAFENMWTKRNGCIFQSHILLFLQKKENIRTRRASSSFVNARRQPQAHIFGCNMNKDQQYPEQRKKSIIKSQTIDTSPFCFASLLHSYTFFFETNPYTCINNDREIHRQKIATISTRESHSHGNKSPTKINESDKISFF